MRRLLVRFLFDHRAIPQRILRAVVRDPVAVTLPNFRLLARLDDFAVGLRIALKRSYEPHVQACMETYLKPGANVLDVGSNIGYYTMLAASRIGDGGRVLAFDPSRSNIDMVQASAELNHFGNVEVHCVAVSNDSGLVSFTMDDSNGGINRGEIGVSAEWVQSVALDAYLKPDLRIDLVKVDIEGSEGLAIQGMRGMLERWHPVLFTEFTPGALPLYSGMTPEEYLGLLRGLGYRLRAITERGTSPGFLDDDEILSLHRETGNDHIDLVGTVEEA